MQPAKRRLLHRKMGVTFVIFKSYTQSYRQTAFHAVESISFFSKGNKTASMNTSKIANKDGQFLMFLCVGVYVIGKTCAKIDS